MSFEYCNVFRLSFLEYTRIDIRVVAGVGHWMGSLVFLFLRPSGHFRY